MSLVSWFVVESPLITFFFGSGVGKGCSDKALDVISILLVFCRLRCVDETHFTHIYDSNSLGSLAVPL